MPVRRRREEIMADKRVTRFLGRGAALFVVAVSLTLTFSCPQPISNTVLLVADDQIAPTIEIASPASNSLLVSEITLEGYLGDSSQSAGDGQGSLKQLDFEVLDADALTASVTFNPDTGTVAEQVLHEGQSFTFDPDNDGYFTFTFTTVDLSGDQHITLILEDMNGNRTTRSLDFLDPGVGPILSIESPANNMNYSATVFVEGYIRDYGSDDEAPTFDEIEYLRYTVDSVYIEDESIALDGYEGDGTEGSPDLP